MKKQIRIIDDIEPLFFCLDENGFHLHYTILKEHMEEIEDVRK